MPNSGIRMKPALLLLIFSFSLSAHAYSQTQNEIRAALRKAAAFMVESVSNRGGCVWTYSSDLTERWGEIPARWSQIWLQSPGTSDIGAVFLETYNVTGDSFYLTCAEKSANALISGQHPEGGWHYFIDFDQAGIKKYYEEVASQCWGWEEYYHYYGNCTFDDDVHTNAARFLLDLYLATGIEKYENAVNKAIQFMLDSQYENGAWPQRYPIFPDYTSYYTFNDNVIRGNILFLLEAHEKLDREDCETAAKRGMDFYLFSQLPPPQAGWAQQYSHDLKPAQARSYEPAAVVSTQTVECIKDLMMFYKITGNKKYLLPIPDALDWLNNSIINMDASKGFTHAVFYEVDSNKPLYAHREGEDKENGRYWIDYEQSNFPGHYGMLTSIDISALEDEYLKINSLSPHEARNEYPEEKQSMPLSQEGTDNALRNIILSLDERGAWITDIDIPYYPNFKLKGKHIQGLTTRMFISNMRILIRFLDNAKK